MKNTTRLDVTAANDLTLEREIGKLNITDNNSAELVSDLGGEWSESKLGAELRCQVDNVSAVANVFKKSNGKYGFNLNIDTAVIGNAISIDTPQACVENILSGLDSIAKSCSELHREAYLKNCEEQNESASTEDSVQRQLDDAANEGMANLAEED